MTTRNANAPTTMIDEKMARNVINAWYLYVYFILVMDSLVAMSVMKKTSCCWHDSAREREGEREFSTKLGDGDLRQYNDEKTTGRALHCSNLQIPTTNGMSMPMVKMGCKIRPSIIS